MLRKTAVCAEDHTLSRPAVGRLQSARGSTQAWKSRVGMKPGMKLGDAWPALDADQC
jgi:hypothetical protein